MAITPTAHYAYSKQDAGDVDWEVALNATLDLVDADLWAEHNADGTHKASTFSGNVDINGSDLIIDTDGDSYLHESADDVIDLVLAGASGEFAIHINGAEDFKFTANAFNVLSGSSIIMADGIHFLGDTANAKMTLGLTINQAANDDEIVDFKSSDVGHAITTNYEADSFGAIKKAEAAAGGLMVVGLKDGDGVAGHAVHLRGILDEAAADTTKTAAGIGVVTIDGCLEGTNVAAVCGADENLVVIRSLTTTRFIFDQEGEMHSDAIIGVGDDWDEWDDLALASDFSRLPKAKFSDMMRYKAKDFEEAGLLTLSTDEDGNQHAFLKHKAFIQFYACCFAEVAERLKLYESALLSLGVQPEQLVACHP